MRSLAFCWVLGIAMVAAMAGGQAFAQASDRSISSILSQPVVSGTDTPALNPKKPEEPTAKATFDARYSAAGNELNSRIVAAFRDLPLAGGAWFTSAGHLRRYLAGFALKPVDGLTFNVSGQHVEESARSALSFNSPAWLSTNSVSGGVEMALPINGVTLVGNYDHWRSLQTQLSDDDLMAVDFLGVEGRRFAAGLNVALTPALSLRATGGQEQAISNGVSGFFGTLDLKAVIDSWTFSAGYWTSPNFGNGLQVALDYALPNRATFGVFGGYQKSTPEKPFVGLRFSLPLASPTDFKSSAQLVGGLDQHMGRMVNTMPGLPITAKNSGAIRRTLKPNLLAYLFETVYGSQCSTAEVTPGCTFQTVNGLRVTVTQDPHYDRYGNGSNDLGFVQFDGAGNAAVYNNLGQFQYFADVSDFAGYIGGTTIGVGTTGLYWENVASGTYWLGKNGVLYSANLTRPNFGDAVN